jgi:hypothetical protein
VSNAPQNPTHLFISYASEDVVLATWLARKLAALGYAVWFDRIEMLGGEPWPQTIDDAIKNRTFRMLALISRDSLRKQKPTGERTLAQKIGENRSIPDFLIPLKIADTELDWLTTPTSYISLTSGWAGSFRQLLAKLSKLNAPKTLSSGAALAALSFPTGDDLITSKAEDLLANVMRVNSNDVFRLAQSVIDLINDVVADNDLFAVDPNFTAKLFQLGFKWLCPPFFIFRRVGDEEVIIVLWRPIGGNLHAHARMVSSTLKPLQSEIYCAKCIPRFFPAASVAHRRMSCNYRPIGTARH